MRTAASRPPRCSDARWPTATSPAAAAIEKAGNKIIKLDPAETQRWARAAAGVRAVWFQQVAEKGIDGPKLAEQATLMLDKYQSK